MKFQPKSLVAGIGIVLALLYGSVAVAHHSAAQFDFSKRVIVKGTVKQFTVMNPHTRATLVFTDANGATHEVEYEGHSASNFYRAGYTRDAVKVGDHISVQIAPRRDGTDGGFIVGFTTEQGKTIGFGNFSPSTGEAKQQ
ncbi:MAG TPA: DUF6152 family protein [Steroidobacteraceae bacterium]|nr:DUF6152 family protein [Steroidobacteraceae bacterium]